MGGDHQQKRHHDLKTDHIYVAKNQWVFGSCRTQWRSGAVAQWRSGAVAQWRSGAVAHWRSGAVAQWRSGALAETSDSRERESGLETCAAVSDLAGVRTLHVAVVQYVVRISHGFRKSWASAYECSSCINCCIPESLPNKTVLLVIALGSIPVTYS